jgi:PRTRC genetic system protein A
MLSYFTWLVNRDADKFVCYLFKRPKRVSWTVEYGKITKNVTDAKGMTIAKMKSDIEASKEFLDALKKAKDKNPACKVKPRVTAQSKGTAASGYKGVFANMDDVEAAGKVISYLPARDGKVYEIRKNALGKFITPVVGCELLSDVKAGFIPAFGIPRIPMDLIMKIITFFRYFTQYGGDNEVLVNIYWDSQGNKFIVDTPEQLVSKISVHSSANPDYQNERYIHFMDIHSHNSMRAFFSHTDDNDEKATRLYTVIGRLDKYFPEIKTRISNGGKFHEIDPSEVFEYIACPFPPEWEDKVITRAKHEDIDNCDVVCDCAANQYPFCKGNDEECPWNLNRNKDGEL